MKQIEINERIAGLKNMVGGTPLLKINYKYKGKERAIFTKAEYLNLTGSIKDRMAYHIIRNSYENGTLQPGMHITEATSGNSGISFAAIGRAMGHRVTIFMPDWMSCERINLMKSFGAEIRLVSKEEGGFLGSIGMTQELAKAQPDKVFLPCQFDNVLNCEAHFTTGKEIEQQFRAMGIAPDAFVAGVGTGGTVMGVGQFLKGQFQGITIHPLEPSNSPTLSTGYKVGKHRIQGISDEFIPSIVKLGQLEQIVNVDDGDSIIMAQMLARCLGLGVGISSGANFIGAVELQNEMGDAANVVTVFADDNKKYLSTDYAREEPVKEGFLSPDIELLSVEAHRL